MMVFNPSLLSQLKHSRKTKQSAWGKNEKMPANLTSSYLSIGLLVLSAAITLNSF
jgi:hypothetical protein